MIAFALAVGAPILLSFFFTLAFTRSVERRYGPVGRLVPVRGGRLHVIETPARGRERGVAMLVHGASGNAWDPHVALAERLAGRGFRVLSVDRPGHGWSDRLGGDDAALPQTQAARIREAAAALGVRRAVVVVHSLAGALGLAMALDAPDFVCGLVLLAPVSHPWKGGVSWYYTAATAPFVGALFRWLVAPAAGRAILASGLASVFAPNPVPDDYLRRTRLELMLRPRQFLANSEDFVVLCAATRALAPRYRDLRVPVAVVMGAADRLVSAEIHARALAREIPGATLALLPGIGHSPHFSAPEAVVAAIEEVFARAAAATPAAAE